VLQALEPWLSSADIDAGSRWHQELGSRLSSSSFGIICLTPENQSSNWLLYESGALSKSVENARVVPYLIGLRKADVDGPLSHFQAAESDHEGTLELLRSLNVALAASGERALSEIGLERAYEVWWPELETHLQKAREFSSDVEQKTKRRDPEEMVLEVVENTRSLSRRFEALLERLEPLTPPRVPQQTRKETAEPEAIEATRQALATLLLDLEGEASGPGMEAAVARWQGILTDSTSSFDVLSEALKGAKGMRSYLDNRP